MSAGLPTLAGPRVVLRPFVLADASDVQRLAGERDIAATTALIPHPYEDGMAEAWIATHADRFARDEAATFAVTLGATGELLGAISLQIRREHARAELGYWIGKPYWGRGYCTEAGGLVLRFAFEELRLARVFAAHFKSNEASGRVLQRLGLRPEGVFRSHMLKWGAPQDAVFCG
ncbi:MAG TPA: GNAT family N-acetyltransferase, partial [Planctomycetota bacterium]|nr:GNAT family N-acetyltransferase [Planctomycetota bacterium]